MNQKLQAVKPGTAPLTNVSLCLASLTRAIDRPRHLPGIVVFYGPSGYGKSTAATVATIAKRACYVQARSSWTRKATHEAICKGLGLRPGKTVAEMSDQIAEELALSGRPLIVDEADYLVERGAIEIIRDIYEASQAPIMLIGEENLPNALKRWERFHGRVLDWCPAQPVSFADTQALCKLHVTKTAIVEDLLRRVYAEANGSARRVCVNLALIESVANSSGIKEMDLATWGERELFTGEAPVRGR